MQSDFFYQALWEQKDTLSDYASRLKQLRAAVDRPSDMTVPQWVQLMAMVSAFRPELIIELGRGYGNSTTVFTDYANLAGDCDVVSIGLDGTYMWEKVTRKRLAEHISDTWFDPLTDINDDIMNIDFSRFVQDKYQRILLFWDAHGDKLAQYILGHILPLIANRKNFIAIHDVTDVRYHYSTRAYIREDGEPTVFMGFMACPFSEIIRVYDFLSRNQIPYSTIDHDIHLLKQDKERLNELKRVWSDKFTGDEFPLYYGGMMYFSLDPGQEIVFPEVPDKTNAQPAISMDLIEPRPEDFRVRELIHGILVRLGWRFGLHQ